MTKKYLLPIYDGSSWYKPTRPIKRTGNDIFPVMKASPKEGLIMDWQGCNGDNCDILFSEFKQQNWIQPELDSSDPGNDWKPGSCWN